MQRKLDIIDFIKTIRKKRLGISHVLESAKQLIYEYQISCITIHVQVKLTYIVLYKYKTPWSYVVESISELSCQLMPFNKTILIFNQLHANNMT